MTNIIGQKRRRIKYGALLAVAVMLVSIPAIVQGTKPPAIRVTGDFGTTYDMPYHYDPLDHMEVLTESYFTLRGPLNGFTMHQKTFDKFGNAFGGSAKGQVEFRGTFNGSETGTFQATMNGAYSKPFGDQPGALKAKLEIIPDSGTGGLKDVCGVGQLEGKTSGNGYYGTYVFELRFGEACDLN